MLKSYLDKFVNGGLEYFLIIFFTVYAVNYLVGIRRNQSISQKWLEIIRPVIFSNFAVIGTGNEALKSEEMIEFE